MIVYCHWEVLYDGTDTLRVKEDVQSGHSKARTPFLPSMEVAGNDVHMSGWLCQSLSTKVNNSEK